MIPSIRFSGAFKFEPNLRFDSAAWAEIGSYFNEGRKGTSDYLETPDLGTGTNIITVNDSQDEFIRDVLKKHHIESHVKEYVELEIHAFDTQVRSAALASAPLSVKRYYDSYKFKLEKFGATPELSEEEFKTKFEAAVAEANAPARV